MTMCSRGCAFAWRVIPRLQGAPPSAACMRARPASMNVLWAVTILCSHDQVTGLAGRRCCFLSHALRCALLLTGSMQSVRAGVVWSGESKKLKHQRAVCSPLQTLCTGAALHALQLMQRSVQAV